MEFVTENLNGVERSVGHFDACGIDVLIEFTAYGQSSFVQHLWSWLR